MHSHPLRFLQKNQHLSPEFMLPSLSSYRQFQFKSHMKTRLTVGFPQVVCYYYQLETNSVNLSNFNQLKLFIMNSTECFVIFSCNFVRIQIFEVNFMMSMAELLTSKMNLHTEKWTSTRLVKGLIVLRNYSKTWELIE